MSTRSRIKILDEATRNLIAAGEVIERPASVVKELLENALDAGAGRITVEIEGAGSRLIRVSDDGEGMGPEDVELAFCRHATSKIAGAGDLAVISTMGFRGEALPSIASVSRFELASCARQTGTASRIIIEAGSTVERAEASRAPGTTATVRNLFYNVPARRKFLKSDHTEMRHISRIVTCLAIAQVETGFRLVSEGRDLLSVIGCSSVAERVRDIFGPKRTGKLLPVRFERGERVVSGLISAPDSATSARPDQYLFINRRPFSSRSLAHAVRQGYQSTLTHSAQPAFFLFLTLRPEQVDVNVHPAKLEVRFRDEGLMYSIVQKAVKESLQQTGAVADYNSGSESGRLITVEKRAGSAGTGKGLPGFSPGRPAARKEKNTQHAGGFQRSFLRPLSPEEVAGGQPQGGKKTLLPEKEEKAGETSPTLQTGGATDGKADSQFPGGEPGQEPRSVWQLHDKYLFVESREGCLIIDQHAAHERVLYEQILAGFQQGDINPQGLLFPLTVELSPEEHSTVAEFGQVLARAGFEIENFSGRTIAVRAVPALGGVGNPEEYFRELLHDLADKGRDSKTGSALQRIVRCLACRAAVKAGQRLSPGEMKNLVEQLFATELPYADVHGRNTIIKLSTAEMDKRFGRN
ncbi:MAG: DNA mismatch repair endonuclease MutL [Gemmatimonadota bacterium]|nr:DNA mismatch repair endonuclease MutL [Gemmatimonadota bacterium]